MTQHRLIRPPEARTANDELTDVERWTGEAWIPDDGQPGVCFSGMRKIGPAHIYPDCQCALSRDRHPDQWQLDCPREIAVRRSAERFGGSSGVLVEDPAIIEQRRQIKLANTAAREAVLKYQADLIAKAQALGLPIGRIDYDGLLIRWSDLPTWLRSGGA